MEDGYQVILRAAAWVVLGITVAWVINALFPHKPRDWRRESEDDDDEE